MTQIHLSQFNITMNNNNRVVLPNADDAPIGPTEKLVKEDVRKLTQSSEEIKKLKEQIEKKENKPD